MDSSLAQEVSFNLAGLRARQGVRAQAVARLLSNAIFYSLLALIASVSIIYGTVQPQWEAAFECAVFALTGLWIIEGLLSHSWQIRGLRLLLPLLALTVLAFAQTLRWWSGSNTAGAAGRRALSADPFETRLFAFKFLALTLTLALLMRYTSSPRRLRALIYLVMGIGLASALFGVARGASQSAGPSFILPYLLPGTGYGQFINPNHFAFLMEMSLGLALGLIVGGGVRLDRLLFYVAAVVTMWTALVFSNSRGGIFSMISQMTFIALLFTTLRPWRQRPGGRLRDPGWLRRVGSSPLVRAALIACLLAVIAVGVVLVGGDALVSRLEVLPDELSAASNNPSQGVRRMEIWRATGRLIEAHPIVGVGFGAYATAIPQYHNASGEAVPQQAHNDYLELLASGGVIGFAFGTWFVLTLVKQARQRLRAKDPFRRAACFGALVGLFGIAVHCLTDFGLHVTINALIFVTLVAVAVVPVADEDQLAKSSQTFGYKNSHD